MLRVPSAGMLGYGLKLQHRKIQLGTTKHFHSEDGQILKPVVQRDCGVSIHRRIQKLTGHDLSWSCF